MEVVHPAEVMLSVVGN